MEQNETSAKTDLAYIRETLASCREYLNPESTQVKMIDASFETLDRLEKNAEPITPFWIDSAALEYARRVVSQTTANVQRIFIEAMTRVLEPDYTGKPQKMITAEEWRNDRRNERREAVRQIGMFIHDPEGFVDGLTKPYDAEIERLIGECKKAMHDWRRFQDFIVGEGPEEFFRLEQAREQSKGVIEKFMKYLSLVWKAKGKTEENLRGMTEARDRFCGSVNRIANILGYRDKQCYAPEAVERWAQEIVEERGKLNLMIGGIRTVLDGDATVLPRLDISKMPEWIAMTERQPTKEDANRDGELLFKFANGSATNLPFDLWSRWGSATHWARLDG